MHFLNIIYSELKNTVSEKIKFQQLTSCMLCEFFSEEEGGRVAPTSLNGLQS